MKWQDGSGISGPYANHWHVIHIDNNLSTSSISCLQVAFVMLSQLCTKHWMQYTHYAWFCKVSTKPLMFLKLDFIQIKWPFPRQMINTVTHVMTFYFTLVKFLWGFSWHCIGSVTMQKKFRIKSLIVDSGTAVDHDLVTILFSADNIVTL